MYCKPINKRLNETLNQIFFYFKRNFKRVINYSNIFLFFFNNIYSNLCKQNYLY